jgi:hypothetical protein
MSVIRSKQWYQDFREERPTRLRKFTVRLPKAVAVMGYLDAVSYRTTVGREARRYKHTFARGCYPLLCTDGKRLYILAGRYHVTERGIVDLSPSGKELE